MQKGRGRFMRTGDKQGLVQAIGLFQRLGKLLPITERLLRRIELWEATSTYYSSHKNFTYCNVGGFDSSERLGGKPFYRREWFGEKSRFFPKREFMRNAGKQELESRRSDKVQCVGECPGF